MFNKKLKTDLEKTADLLAKTRDSLTETRKATWGEWDRIPSVEWNGTLIGRIEAVENEISRLYTAVRLQKPDAWDAWLIERVVIDADPPEHGWQWELKGPTKRDADGTEWRPIIEWGREKTYAKARREMLIAMMALNNGVRTEPSQHTSIK